MKFRKRPVVVEAIQWDGKFRIGIGDFSWMLRLESQNEKCPICKHLMKEHGQIINKGKGGDILCPGDWIIIEADGKRIGCRAKVFESRYMPLDDTNDKEAKWLAAIVENGEPYDDFESMPWSEFAGGEEMVGAFRELAATLFDTYLSDERVKKHPPKKRALPGTETGG